MKVAIAQIAPVLLDRAATTAKVAQAIEKAGAADCALVAFGETLIPAYPVWLSRSDAARFNAGDQKQIHAAYVDQAVDLDADHLDPVRDAARQAGITVVLGIAERSASRGNNTIFCTRVIIEGTGDHAGQILSAHRKLMPTHEERLGWGIGDGSGLVTHRVGPFRLGSLNCWENWMPLARSALYAAGEDLHVALWPGCKRLTQDITRFIALESRSFVLSACSIIRETDIPTGVPFRDRWVSPDEPVLYDGGSCIAAPDGSWLVEPVVGKEKLIVADLDHALVAQERHNFDPAGHYARPEILRLTVDRRRQVAAEFIDDPSDVGGEMGLSSR